MVEQDEIDTVICLNVLEHIENDIIAVENMFEILKPTGHLIVFVPAFQILFSSMDEFAGHYRRYTFTTFNNLIKNLKMEILLMEYFNPIGGIGWYLNKFIKHKELDSKFINKQIKIFDKYITPVSSLINPLTSSFFGQSLLFVGEKTF